MNTISYGDNSNKYTSALCEDECGYILRKVGIVPDLWIRGALLGRVAVRRTESVLLSPRAVDRNRTSR